MGGGLATAGGLFSHPDFDYEARTVLGWPPQVLVMSGWFWPLWIGLTFFPRQPRQLYDLLPGAKEITRFRQAQGASFHCQPAGRQLTHTQMFDWLAEYLPASGGS